MRISSKLMKAVGTRWWVVAALVLVLLAVAAGTQHELEARAQRKRQASYELALRSYQQALKPGITRKEVESYLHKQKDAFDQTCCVDPKESATRSSWDDIVKIGEEKPPSFCGANNVYIAFQFIDHERRQGYEIRDSDLDTLKAISIYYQSGPCL
jgi:hypothetical protein